MCGLCLGLPSRIHRLAKELPVTVGRYLRTMAAKPVMTAEELAEAMRHAPPATADEVTVLADGRRIDSLEDALAWLAELAAMRPVASQPAGTRA
jgi:hypothetical protein